MSTFRPADRLAVIPEYIFARLAKAAKEVEQASGRPVLDFGAGTPDIPPSRRYTDKFAELVKANGSHAYPGYGATPAFAAALKQWYKTRFSVDLGDSPILPLAGSKDGIAHLPLALLNAGDEVLVPDPGYPPFSEPAVLIGAKPVAYDLDAEQGFKLDLKALQVKLTDKTRYLWLNFPSNPTGQAASLEELQATVDFARQHGLYILYDNAYSEITFDNFQAPSILQIEGAQDLAVELGSFSKSHSFAGFRIGWITGNADIVNSLAKIKTQMDSGVSLPIQGLVSYVLTEPDQAWHKQMIETYRQRRDTIAGYLQSIGLKFDLPPGSLYIWAKIPDEVASSEAFCMELLKTKQILMTPGSAFGRNGERYVRVSICVNIDNIKEYF